MKLLLIFVLGISLATFTANAQKYTFEHQVSQGETISGIAKKYNVSIKTIEQFNEGLNINSISIGQAIIIPSSQEADYIAKTYGIAPQKIKAVLKGDDDPLVFDSDNFNNKPVFTRKDPTPETDTSKKETVATTTQSGKKATTSLQNEEFIRHYVKDGETLYSLSQKYNVPVASIKEWNNLKGDFLPVSEYVIIGKKGVTYYASDKPVTSVRDFETQENFKDSQVHIVKQGETLYSLSKKYGVVVGEIKRINKFENNDIQIGQIVFLTERPENQVKPTMVDGNPTRPPVYNENPPQQPTNPTRPPVNMENMRPVMHEVQPSETLYQIAKQYNKSLQQLQDWNNLKDNHIETSDQLIVGYYQEQNTAQDYNEKNTYGQSQKYMRVYDIKHRRTDAYKLMKESGMATWIPKSGAADNNLYVLHKTAPVNSIIKVVNPMNKRVVYVKVIGQLQNKIGEETINMKLTAEAVKRLQLLDDRFRLEWSYHIQK